MLTLIKKIRCLPALILVSILLISCGNSTASVDKELLGQWRMKDETRFFVHMYFNNGKYSYDEITNFLTGPFINTTGTYVIDPDENKIICTDNFDDKYDFQLSYTFENGELSLTYNGWEMVRFEASSSSTPE